MEASGSAHRERPEGPEGGKAQPFERGPEPGPDRGPDPASTPGGEPAVIAGYRVAGGISHTPVASVYKAFRNGSANPVVLKLMHHPIGSGAHARRAWRDLDLIEQLALPSVPRLLDQGIHEGRLFFATEFVEGTPLLAFCEDEALGYRERVELLVELAESVHVLHEQGLIHGCIKPTNIVIDDAHRPVIIDLGIATLGLAAVSPDETSTAAIRCLAPEQFRSDALCSTRTDVYGLGATAYEVLTGHSPHDLDVEHHEAMRRIACDEPRNPRELAPQLPRPVAAILRRSVAQSPADRYGSASAMASDLRRWLAGEPVEAAGYTTAERFGCMIGRHPALTLLGLIALLGLTAAITALLVR